MGNETLTMWSGKLTERLLLRMSEEMARTIRARAEVNHRSIQGEIRFLVERGLQHSIPKGRKNKPGAAASTAGHGERMERESAA